jgi:hypothetical protein
MRSRGSVLYVMQGTAKEEKVFKWVFLVVQRITKSIKNGREHDHPFETGRNLGLCHNADGFFGGLSSVWVD